MILPDSMNNTRFDQERQNSDEDQFIDEGMAYFVTFRLKVPLNGSHSHIVWFTLQFSTWVYLFQSSEFGKLDKVKEAEDTNIDNGTGTDTDDDD